MRGDDNKNWWQVGAVEVPIGGQLHKMVVLSLMGQTDNGGESAVNIHIHIIQITAVKTY